MNHEAISGMKNEEVGKLFAETLNDLSLSLGVFRKI